MLNSMSKSFYRKVGFGLGLEDKVPSDPLKWAHNQLDAVPPLAWGENLSDLTASLFKI